MTTFHKPIWDRGDEIDEDMLRFTIGDDWKWDQRLVLHDLRGSIAHADGLSRVGLIDKAEHAAITDGLRALVASFEAGDWTVEPGDEDVHSAVERRLIDAIGDAGKKLHTGRSRNDQVAVDMRLWLRDAVTEMDAALGGLIESCVGFAQRYADVPIPGYTHLRRAMPSSLSDWMNAFVAAFELDRFEFESARRRIARCPLGSGAGYGVPLPLDRDGVAQALGFEGPEQPVTLTQHARGRAELAYVTALETIALDLSKLANDLWLYTTSEFSFFELPVALSTGSSLMPHKRNPDLVELLRANARQVSTDRASLIAVLRDLTSGYHRDFQLAKPPLFRAHDRILAALPLTARLIERLIVKTDELHVACDDPSLNATKRLLERAAAGESFRDAYRDESRQA